jgi:hypothetical protein
MDDSDPELFMGELTLRLYRLILMRSCMLHCGDGCHWQLLLCVRMCANLGLVHMQENCSTSRAREK